MARKIRMAVLLLAIAAAVGLAPGMALAATDGGTDTSLPLSTQASKNLDNCTIKFTDNVHVCADTAEWQMFYAKGKDASVKPAFNLYCNGKLVPRSAYTVSYRLTYWDEAKDKDVTKAWSKPLTPSASPVANEEDMSSEFIIVAKAKSGSGYTGTYTRATAVVTDYYNVGRNMGKSFTKAKASWRYAINPMNANYYVIPQAKVKATLNSFVLLAGAAPGEGSVNIGGTKVASKYYKVYYFKARKDAVQKNLSPASRAKTGKALDAMPTDPGSYVMIIKGKAPYYGTASIYFDIQGSLDDVKIGKIAAQKENGEYIEPGVRVTYKGAPLTEGVDYVVTYADNLKAGTATATVTGSKVATNRMGVVWTESKARYFTGSKSLTFKIKKNASKSWADNTLSASSRTVNVSQAGLRELGDQTINAGTAFAAKNAIGALTYTKVSGPSVVTVAKKTGKVTVAAHAGLIPANTYKVKVKVLASGDDAHYALAKTVTLTVVVE